MANILCFNHNAVFAVTITIIGFYAIVLASDTNDPANKNQLAPKSDFSFTPDIKFSANGSPRLRTMFPTVPCKHKITINGSAILSNNINPRTAKALEIANDGEETLPSTIVDPLDQTSTGADHTEPMTTSQTTTPVLTTLPAAASKFETISTAEIEISTTSVVMINLPEVATTLPDVATTSPETATIPPEVATTPSEVSTTLQEVATTPTEVTTITPEVAEIATEVMQTTPEASTTVHNGETVTTKEAETTDIPEVDATSPEAVKTTTEAATNTPESAETTPEADKTVPEAVPITPEGTTTVQEIATITPEVVTDTPKAATTTIEIAPTAQEMVTTSTEIIKTTQEALDHIPEISTTAQEIITTSTEIIKTTQEVSDNTPGIATQEQESSKTTHEMTTTLSELAAPEKKSSTMHAITSTTEQGEEPNLETTDHIETETNSVAISAVSLISESSSATPSPPEGVNNNNEDPMTNTEAHVSLPPEVESSTLEPITGSPSPHLVAPPKSSDSQTNQVGQQEPSVKSQNESSDTRPMDETTSPTIMHERDTLSTVSATTTFSKVTTLSDDARTDNSSESANTSQSYFNLPKRIRTKVERMLGDQLPFGFDINSIQDEVEQELDQGINNVKNKVANSTNTVFETIKNFATTSIEQIQNYPIQAFATIKEKALKTVNSEQATAIMERLKTAENVSLWRRLGESLKGKLDPSYIVSLIALAPSKLGSAASGLVQSLGHRLGLTSTWNASLIESLGPSVLLLLPPDIMKIKDKEAKAKILGILWNSDTFRNKSDVRTNEEVLLTSIIQDVYGPVQEWTSINETLAKYLPRMAPLIINKIRMEVINTSLTIIGGVDYYDRPHAQPIISKALNSVNFTAIALPDAQEFFHSLGKLISYLRFEDMEALPRRILENDGVLATLARNADMDKELARWILSINQPTGDWTKGDVIRLHFFLQFSSGRLLRQLDSQGLLDRQLVTMILKRPDLELGQLHAVKDMSIPFYNHDGLWDVESAPAGILPVIQAAEIAKLRPEDIVNNLDKFNQIVNSLDASQKMAITNKLLELGLRRALRARTHAHPDFLSLISMTDISSLSDTDQLELLQNLPIDSPQVRNYVNNRVNSNLTLESFRKDALMAKSFTCEMLELFKPEEVMELLVVLRSSSGTCPLLYKTAKCFVEKLKSYLSTLPVEVAEGDDETKLLSTLKESELAIVGGEIFIHFSADSLQDQHPPSRCLQIFTLIGQLPLSIINLLQPYEKKQQLARASLNCLDKQEDIMGLSEMMTIGNLMGYLPEISIDKLGSDAFALNLPHLLANKDSRCQQSSLNAPTIKPCLNLGIRNAIRRKLPIVFESPSSWCETVVQSIGCLLSTLYHDQLRDINDRALLASIDKLNQCWDNEHSPEKGDQSDIYTTFCSKELLSATITIDEAERQLKIRLKNAALGDIAQLSRKRRIAYLASAASLRLTCDVIRRANSAITEITLEELDTMDDFELRDCLEELGKYAMSLAKAHFLWGRTKKAFNSSAADLDSNTFNQMGFIMQAIGIEEISTLNLNNTGIISVFGTERNLNLQQLRGLAAEVKSDYQDDAMKYTPSDLLTFGNILCGFEAADLAKIQTKYFTDVVYRLGDTISKCHSDTKKTLAQIAVEGFGHTRNWTSVTVTSVGAIIGGLKASEFSAIPGRSFDGLKANYVKAIPPSSIKTLEPHQFRNFSIEAINYLTEAQLSQLNSDQLSAVNQLKSLYGRGSAVSQMGWTLPLLVTAVLMIT